MPSEAAQRLNDSIQLVRCATFGSIRVRSRAAGTKLAARSFFAVRHLRKNQRTEHAQSYRAMARRLATHLEAAHRVDPELRVRIMTAHDALRDAADLLEHEGDYADVLEQRAS